MRIAVLHQGRTGATSQAFTTKAYVTRFVEINFFSLSVLACHFHPRLLAMAAAVVRFASITALTAVTTMAALLLLGLVTGLVHPCDYSSTGTYRSSCEAIMTCPSDAYIVPRPIPTFEEYQRDKCGNNTKHCFYGSVSWFLETTDCYSTEVRNPFCNYARDIRSIECSVEKDCNTCDNPEFNS